MPADSRGAQSPSRVDDVVEAIRSSIRDGRYVPGQRLVEADLTRTFHISRGPLREAMRRLAGDGLVVIEPHRGVSVRKLSQRDLRELYDVREMLESLAARAAATNIDRDDNRKRLIGVMEDMEKYKDSTDVMAYTSFNNRFHSLIVEISGNRYLANLIDHLRAPIFRHQFNRFLDLKAKKASITEHEVIAKAILEGNAPAAEKAMRKHIQQSGHLIQQLASED